ncbi:MAG: hypothetical protein SPE18_05450 [Candidatus Limivicinus sp.]|nr:hypothetical protein [Candidatus Limivicinus sp.]
MWSVFYLSLKEGVSREQWLTDWTQTLSEHGGSAKAVDIQEYAAGTYAQTIQEVRMAARAAVFAAALVMFVVVASFTRLLVAEDRNEISLRKALGFTGRGDGGHHGAFRLRKIHFALSGVRHGPGGFR